MKLLWSLLLGWPLLAGFTTPALQSPVMDQAHIMSESTRATLSGTLHALKEQGGSQVTVLTVPTLDGLEIEQATIQITDAWKLGEKGKDNGVLFLISTGERRMRIEVGQGLQGDLPDVTAKRIIADVVKPQFANGDFEAGIILGVVKIVKATDPNFPIEQYLRGHVQLQRHSQGGGGIWLIIFLIILISVIRMSGSGFGGGRPGGYWGGGGFGGGGGGGGGWSGGGGGFNGGGASGDW